MTIGRVRWAGGDSKRFAKVTSEFVRLKALAGAPGFEPGDGGIKIRCLTTWLRPNAAFGAAWIPLAWALLGPHRIAAALPPRNEPL